MVTQIGPMARYRAVVTERRLRPDPAQRAAIEKLQLLDMRLKRGLMGGQRGWLGAFRFSRRGEAEDHGGGIYLYGGVGRGKSMLMDLFFESTPAKKKRYVHFHAFMQEAHKAIHAARERGVSDPIPEAVEALAGDLALVCFDEMQVTDIADAMILGRLFEGLFERDVAMVVTSNRHPRDLYKNGLQRERFVPFIDMICKRLDVHQLDGGLDYRLERLREMDVYHSPLGPDATAAMNAAWEDVTDGQANETFALEVHGRMFTLARYVNGAGRAPFADLCAQPLGAADYLAISGAVRTLFIDDIPKLSRAQNNEAKRFVTLVDTLYENRVHLVCSADAPPQGLYVDGEGAFEFERTASRLIEMQSADWFERSANEGGHR